MFIGGRLPGSIMARSDSFFIRATVSTDTTNYNQTSIDLGSFVDALGKTILRIRNISVAYGSPLSGFNAVPTNAMGQTSFQLTTQSQTALVGLDNRSVISTGVLSVAGGVAPLVSSTLVTDKLDIAPQYWENGYLVAVESIFLGVDQATADLVDEVSIVLECQVETMTQAASMALALSQQ